MKETRALEITARLIKQFLLVMNTYPPNQSKVTEIVDCLPKWLKKRFFDEKSK